MRSLPFRELEITCFLGSFYFEIACIQFWNYVYFTMKSRPFQSHFSIISLSFTFASLEIYFLFILSHLWYLTFVFHSSLFHILLACTTQAFRLNFTSSHKSLSHAIHCFSNLQYRAISHFCSEICQEKCFKSNFFQKNTIAGYVGECCVVFTSI